MIEGGRPLSGSVRAAGNKNGALPILAACLLTGEPVTLTNVPRIRDVETMMALLQHLGADADWAGANEVRVHAADLTTHELDDVLAERIRASFLLAGPLLARVGRASVPPPGGDVIGRRRLDPHLHAFERLGAEISVGERYELRAERLEGTAVFLDEASVMGTENAVMAAVLAPGADHAHQRRVRAARAGSLPVPRLARRRYRGIGSNTLHIDGVDAAFAAGRTASGRSTSRSAASSAWLR